MIVFSERELRKVNLRIWILSLFIVFGYIVLIWKLYQVHITQSEKYRELSNSQYRGTILLPAHRGEIYDLNDRMLAFSEDIYSVAIRPEKVKDISLVADILSKYGIEKEKVFNAFNSGYPFAYIARKALKPPQAQALIRELGNLKIRGVIVERETTGRRIYPYPEVREVVGWVNIDGEGADGVELSLDEHLRGKPGYLVLEFDGRDHPIYYRILKHVPPQSGGKVKLTIDALLQAQVKELAEEVLRRRKAEEVCVMVARRDGRVLAMVSLVSKGKQFGNTCITWGYEPGSTFKPITIAAAIDSGLPPYEKYFSGPTMRVGGWVLNNADDNLYTTGWETMEDIIKYSFNIGTASVALKLGGERFQEYLQRFKFYQLSGIQLKGEAPPHIPNYLEDYSRIYLATSSYGQGLSVNVAQLLRAYLAFANNGLMPEELTIVEELRDSSGKLMWKYHPRYRRVIEKDTALLVRKFLREVVKGGTGRRAEVIGYWPGGKTGTANQARGGEYRYYTASFIGMFPIDDPQYVIAVRVNNPKGKAWGGYIAAPLFREVVLSIVSLYDIPPKPKPKMKIPKRFLRLKSKKAD